MRIVLVHNPSASSVTPRSRVVIAKALSADHDVTLAETNRRGHATRLAQGAANDGVDVVIALGGDGTLNEAANGVAGTQTALAVLPGGSTNVFARTIGLANDPVEATGQLLHSLATPASTIEPIGLGTVNGRYFLFHTGIGLDAELVHQVESRGKLKRYAGHPLFVYCGLLAWARVYDRSRPRFAISASAAGDEAGAGPTTLVVDDGMFTVVQNTNPYTFLGNRPFSTAPDANLDRALTVLTLRSLDARPLLGALASALGSGKRLRYGRTSSYVTDRHEVTVTGYGPFPYQVDGDYLGEASELRFAWVPKAMRLVTITPDG